MSDGPAAATQGEGPRAIGSGERKPVTALFVDIVGSTALAESMDPEEWAELVNGAFRVLAEPVERYDGTVAQLQGDAMLALFGAPVAHDDDPERAVRAALDMLRGMDAYDRDLGHDDRIALQVRIGLNTGPVVVGQVGGDQRQEYTAIGDTMNVAARMQATADPGTIRITAATQRLVAHAVELRDLGGVAVKGRAEPVHAFQVIGWRPVRASPRGLPGMASPLVGRDRELAAMLAAFGAVGPDNGGAVLIIGEPGIGKTRLLQEFRGRVARAAGARWIESQARSHGRTLPFHLVAGLLTELAGIRPDDEPASARTRLASLLSETVESGTSRGDALHEPTTIDYVAHLLSLPVATEDAEAIERLAPDDVQQRYADAIGTVLARSSHDAALVVVTEDVHWADESSVATLIRLLPALSGGHMLLVLTSRPDHGSVGGPLFEAARATFADRARDLALARLSDSESRELVAHLLEIESLPESVRAAILAKADGNPFFAEEVIRMLIDRGAVVRRGDRWVAGGGIESVAIPPTLHGLLLARIDGLPDDARRAIRAASVIGRTFATEILEQVVGPLDGALPALEAAGLLTQEMEGLEGSYAFRHALVQDAAYDSILRRERSEVHRAVAAAIEQSYPDRLDERAVELAHHLEAAGDLVAAGEWAFRAARHAERRGAMPEARELYDRAAAWLPDVPTSAARRVEIALGQGRTGLYFQSFEEEIERLERAVEWAEALGDRHLLVEVYTALAFGLQVRGDQYGSSDALRRAVDRAVELGEGLGDDPIRGRPLLALGVARLMTGGYESALDLLARAVPLLEASGDVVWAFEAQNNLAWALSRVGRLDEAMAAAGHAAALADRSGSPAARIDLNSTVAIIDQERERFDDALSAARSAADEGEDKGILVCAAFGHLVAGEVCLRRGDAVSAERSLKRAARLARVTHALFIENLGRAGLAAARWASGQRAEALAGWADALEAASRSGDRYAVAEVHWRRGAALALSDATRDEGIADLEAAVDGFTSIGARPATARALIDLAVAYRVAGQADAADDAHMRGGRLRAEMGLPVSPPPR